MVASGLDSGSPSVSPADPVWLQRCATSRTRSSPLVRSVGAGESIATVCPRTSLQGAVKFGAGRRCRQVRERTPLHGCVGQQQPACSGASGGGNGCGHTYWLHASRLVTQCSLAGFEPLGLHRSSSRGRAVVRLAGRRHVGHDWCSVVGRCAKSRGRH